MARPKSLKPSYCRDKTTDRAYVVLNGKRKNLGRWDSQASKDAYDLAVAEWIQRGRRPGPAQAAAAAADPAADVVTVDHVIAAFWAHAKTTYPCPPYEEGKRPGGELGNYFDVLRPLRRLYGTLPATEFGPLKLQALRQEFIRLDWCRNVINRHTWRVKFVFAWAAGNEVIQPSTKNQALASVAALRKGTPGVRDTEKPGPVPEAAVEAVLPFLSDHLRAMAEVQRLTGMRSTELCTMRGVDIKAPERGGSDPTAAVRLYQPEAHKTAHLDATRTVFIGPRAWSIIEPFLKPDLSAFLFSPAEAEAKRRERLREERQTPVQPSQLRRAASARGRHRLRAPGERYDRDTYRRAIARACELAFPPPPELERRRVPGRGRKHGSMRWEREGEWQTRLGPEGWEKLEAWREEHDWHPHQLRHSFATMIRSRFGADMVGVMIGDDSPAMVDVYADKDIEAGRRVAAQVG